MPVGTVGAGEFFGAAVEVGGRGNGGRVIFGIIAVDELLDDVVGAVSPGIGVVGDEDADVVFGQEREHGVEP